MAAGGGGGGGGAPGAGRGLWTDAVLGAGGGLGAGGAARALAGAGCAVRLFEARPDPAEAGAGLQIAANGVKALRWLGLEDAVAPFATRPERLELRLPGSGRTVSRVALGAAHAGRYGAPYFHLHRADLHRALFEAARSHPAVSIELGRRVTRAVQTAGEVSIELDNGDTAKGRALIGADGVRSGLREGVAGIDAPVFTGMTAWRAVVPATDADLARPPVATVWMGRGRHLVTYPLATRREINLIGVVEEKPATDESWLAAGAPADMAADFGGWHAETDALRETVDDQLLAALMGDACHAMPPFLAQGACMALEDAVVLARRMAARPGDVAHALRDYSEARRERTMKVQRASWANAWRFHLAHPVLRTCVYGGLAAISALVPSGPGRMYDWLYRYDPATA